MIVKSFYMQSDYPYILDIHSKIKFDLIYKSASRCVHGKIILHS